MTFFLLLLLGAAPVLSAQADVVDGLINAGLPEQALKLCTDLRAQGMSDPALDVVQARAMHMLGMSSEASVLLQKALKHHRHHADIWAMLGIIQADQGNMPDALAALTRAQQLSPEDSDILNNLGFVQMASGDVDAAIASFQKALRLTPDAAQIRNNLGFALARQGRDDEALEMLRSAGSETEARYNLGVACELRRDNACAITQYQAALNAQPSYTPATQALHRLLTPESP